MSLVSLRVHNPLGQPPSRMFPKFARVALAVSPAQAAPVVLIDLLRGAILGPRHRRALLIEVRADCCRRVLWRLSGAMGVIPRLPATYSALDAAACNPVIRVGNRVVDLGMRHRSAGLVEAVDPPAMRTDDRRCGDPRSE